MWRWTVLALAAGAGLAQAATAPPAPKPLGCLIEPDRVAEVGSQVVGVVEQMLVERGDMVQAGQPLLKLRAGVEQANANVAEYRATVNAEVLAAQAGVTLAEQKLQRAEALAGRGFISNQGVEQARGELELARQKLNQGRSQQEIWSQEQRVAQAQLALRTVRSPFAGIVVERYVNTGERVEERPLFRVAVIDPLRVELMVPTALYGSLKLGDTLTIQPELPGAASVQANVRHVDHVLDAASNTFRVRLNLPNPGRALPAGLRCKADLPASAQAGAAGPATAAAARAPAHTAPNTAAHSAAHPAAHPPATAPAPALLPPLPARRVGAL